VEESIRMTEDMDKWRKYVRGVVNPRIDNDRAGGWNSISLARDFVLAKLCSSDDRNH